MPSSPRPASMLVIVSLIPAVGAEEEPRPLFEITFSREDVDDTRH